MLNEAKLHDVYWREAVYISVTNIVSANISPRAQKEIIEIIGENVGKHRQYIGKIKNTKILKNTKKKKITIYLKKSANIAKNRQIS